MPTNDPINVQPGSIELGVIGYSNVEATIHFQQIQDGSELSVRVD
jgi:hypothetical protein